jgi:hypothetical protein
VQLLELAVGEAFDHRESVRRSAHHQDELGQLDLHGEGVAVLGILNQKDHQESDDGGGVDDQLPSVAEAEQWPGKRPTDDERRCRDERDRFAGEARGFMRKGVEDLVQPMGLAGPFGQVKIEAARARHGTR